MGRRHTCELQLQQADASAPIGSARSADVQREPQGCQRYLSHRCAHGQQPLMACLEHCSVWMQRFEWDLSISYGDEHGLQPLKAMRPQWCCKNCSYRTSHPLMLQPHADQDSSIATPSQLSSWLPDSQLYVHLTHSTVDVSPMYISDSQLCPIPHARSYLCVVFRTIHLQL